MNTPRDENEDGQQEASEVDEQELPEEDRDDEVLRQLEPINSSNSDDQADGVTPGNPDSTNRNPFSFDEPDIFEPHLPFSFGVYDIFEFVNVPSSSPTPS